MVVNRDFKWAYHIAKAYSISEVLQGTIYLPKVRLIEDANYAARCKTFLRWTSLKGTYFFKPK